MWRYLLYMFVYYAAADRAGSGQPMDDLQPGDPGSVGGYQLVGRLGVGGMGQVFLGVSPSGRRVAVKLIHPAHAATPQFRDRFAREIEAARRVGGFHTAPVVDADPNANPPWMITAYIEGPSLEEAVAADGPLPPNGVRALGAGLAEGLTAIHAHGLVHRDLKPGNVILAADGPRIIDFGIARAVGATTLTTAGVVVGTFGYMSPEQVRGETIGPGSDVFSLGCVLAFAATGRPPFGGDSAAAVMFRIVTEPPDLADVRDEPLRQLIGDCLGKSPEHRPPLPTILGALTGSGRPATAGGQIQAQVPIPILAQAPVPTNAPALTGPSHQPLSHADTAPPDQRPPVRRSRRRAAALIAAATAAVALAVTLPVALSGRSPQAAAGRRPSAQPSAGILRATARASHPGATPVNGSPGATPVNSSPAAGPGTPSPTAGSSTAGPVSARDITLHAPNGGQVSGIAFSPDGKLVAAATGVGGGAYVWNIATGSLVATLNDPGGYGSLWVAFSPDSKSLAIADSDASAYLWDAATRTLTSTFEDPGGGSVYGLAFSPNGTLLVTADGNRHAYVWNIGTGKLAATLTDPDPGGLSGAAFSPNGTLLATADGDGRAYLWNTATDNRIATLTEPGGEDLNGAAFSPNGTLLATADDNGNAYLWNVAGGTLADTLTAPGSRGEVHGVAFSPDGTLLAEADRDGHAFVWDVATGRVAGTFTGPDGEQIWAVAISPDGALLAAGDSNGNIYLRAMSQLVA
jgi:serine/threonine protein kinase